MTHKLSAFAQDIGSFSRLPRLVRYALRRPKKTWDYVVRAGSRRWIGRYFESTSEYRRMLGEIEGTGLLASMEERLARRFSSISGRTSSGNPYIAGAMSRRQVCNIYALVRQRRPRVLVETGVCNGLSTSVLLAALRENGTGHLYSIDYPEFADDRTVDDPFWQGKGGAVVPPDEESGWLVPDELRDRWTLILGKSSEKLPPLMRDLEQVDLFLHDSEHSFENQLFEFRLAWEHLSDLGLLLASDIAWSKAFDTFWNEVRNDAARHFIDHDLAIVGKKSRKSALLRGGG